MKEINMLDEVMKSQTFRGIGLSLRRYIKWIVIAGIIMLVLSVALLVMIVIGVFNSLIMPLLTNSFSLNEQGQSIMIEGQKWWEQRFTQEQTQLEDIQKQLEDVKQTLEQHNQQDTTGTAN